MIICGWSWGVVVMVPVEIGEVGFLEYSIYAVRTGEVINVLVRVNTDENCFLVVAPLLD